jgi:mRNA interferase RelE/StbE
VAYAVEILRAPEKFLDKLAYQQPSDAEAIEDALDGLSERPRPPGCARLKGDSEAWRFRVGNYRICYRVEEDRLVVLVVTISTRDDVYEMLRHTLGR